MILRHLLRGCSALRAAIFQQPHRRISALYVTGDKANQTYVALTPYFDFRSRLADERRLRANVRSRKAAAAADIDIDELLRLWSVFRDVQQRKALLERKRTAIADRLKAAATGSRRQSNADGPLSEDAVRKLKADGVRLRDDLKRLKEHSYAMEDAFVRRFLALPNDVHPRTPISDQPTVLIEDQPERGQTAAAGHLHSGRQLIDYRDAYRYYLLDEAAEFEQAVCEWFSARWQRTAFVRSSNADFCRSLIAEAAGLDVVDGHLLCVAADGQPPDAAAADAVDRLNRMHLAGSGSLLSFLGYCAKLAPFRSALPLRLVAVGRSYRRRRAQPDRAADDDERGLYGVAQTTTVSGMLAADSPQQAERLFDETLAELVQAYRLFGPALRIVQASAGQLLAAESMRADVQMWSAARSEFVRVASLSYYGDFISKRLLFSYKDGGVRTTAADQQQQQPLFVHLIGASAVDASRLLAVLLEQTDGEFRVPEFLRRI